MRTPTSRRDCPPLDGRFVRVIHFLHLQNHILVMKQGGIDMQLHYMVGLGFVAAFVGAGSFAAYGEAN